MEFAALLLLSLMTLMIILSPLGRLSPAAILAGSWGFVYALQTIFSSDMKSSLTATISIFSITTAFAAGEIIACKGHVLVKATAQRKSTASSSAVSLSNEKKLKNIVIMFGVVSIAGAAQYAYALGLFRANSFSELIILPGIVREQIFAGELDVPLISRIGFLVSYSGVVLSLYYYYLYRWHWYLTLPMISILILGMSQSGRAGLLVVLLQIIIATHFKNTLILKKRFSRFLIRMFAPPIFLIFLIFFGGQFLREGFNTVGAEDFLRVLYSLRGYLFGGISAFSTWVDSSGSMENLSLGRYSFSSLFAALGIFPQAPGIYDEYLSISSSGETSNIFTAYRSFIDDFSLIGACIFYFGAGSVIGLISLAFIKNRTVNLLILIPVLSWLAFSPLASLTYFNSFLLSCIMPYLIVKTTIKTT